MKKNISVLLFAVVLILSGCTSREQNRKIKNFWMGQIFEVFMKYGPAISKHMQKTGPQKAPARTEQPGQDMGPYTPPPAAARTQGAAANPQFFDVTLDEEVFPGPASYEERVRIKRAWDAVQLSNQALLNDLQHTFGGTVKDRAFALTSQTEAKLKREASTAADFQAYFARQSQLLAKQNQDINQLMQQNAASIRRIKTSSGQ